MAPSRSSPLVPAATSSRAPPRPCTAPVSSLLADVPASRSSTTASKSSTMASRLLASPMALGQLLPPSPGSGSWPHLQAVPRQLAPRVHEASSHGTMHVGFLRVMPDSRLPSSSPSALLPLASGGLLPLSPDGSSLDAPSHPSWRTASSQLLPELRLSLVRLPPSTLHVSRLFPGLLASDQLPLSHADSIWPWTGSPPSASYGLRPAPSRPCRLHSASDWLPPSASYGFGPAPPRPCKLYSASDWLPPLGLVRPRTSSPSAMQTPFGLGSAPPLGLVRPRTSSLSAM